MPRLDRWALSIGLVVLAGCAEADNQSPHPGSGGQGGSTGVGGSAGASGSTATGTGTSQGGSTRSGGASATNSSSATGGSSGSSGGATKSGGTNAISSSTTTAGSSGSGGGASVGGSSGSGGALPAGATSGGSTTGGTTSGGGSSATGGSRQPDAGNADGADAQRADGSPASDAGGCKGSTPAQAPSGVTPFRAIDGFVTRNGSTLSLCGQPFQVLGANLYYLQSYSVYEAGNLRTVADGLDDAVRMSLPVVRTWAFNEGATTNDSAIIRTAPGSYNEKALVGLDTAVAEAKKRGIRLILVLTNYWADYGGLPRYAQWAGLSSSATDLTAGQAFYTNTTMQGYFKDYATMLSKRTNTVTGIAYKDEPAILAWEIANEFRCPTCGGSSKLLAAIDALSQFLKSLFPNHLIADGGEGFDDTPSNWGTLSNDYPVAGSEGASYTGLVKLSAIDMASYHYYPSGWGMDITSAASADSDGQTWIDGHQALAKAAGKVAYWGEFGLQVGASDSVRAPIYDSWLGTFFGANDNGPLATFWQLVPASRGADDGYACILGRDPATVAAFEKYSVSRAPR